MPRAVDEVTHIPWPALFLALSCQASSGPAVDSISLGPTSAFPDSLFRASITLLPNQQVDSLGCKWLESDTIVSESTVVPDGSTARCELEGRDADLVGGQSLQLEVTAFVGRRSYDPATSDLVVIQPHPVAMVTELVTGQLAFWDSHTGEVQDRIELFLDVDELPLTDTISGASPVYGYPMKVAYTPEGDTVNVSSSTYGVIWDIDPAAREVLDWRQISRQIYWFEYSDDASQIYVTDMCFEGVTVLDRSSWEVEHQVPTGDYPIGITRDPQGGFWVPHHHNSWTSVLEVVDGALTKVEDLGGPGPYIATVHPDGESMWVACEFEDFVQVYSLPERELIAEVEVGDLPNYVHFTDDGTRAWVSNFHDATVSVVDVATLTEIAVLETGQGAVSIATRMDERYLYVSNLQSATITVIDTQTVEVVDTHDGLGGPRMLEWPR